MKLTSTEVNVKQDIKPQTIMMGRRKLIQFNWFLVSLGIPSEKVYTTSRVHNENN